MMFLKFATKQKKLQNLVSQGIPVWVVYLDLFQFHEVEFRYGNEVCRRILDILEQELEETLKSHRSFFQFTLLEARGGDDFVIYLVPHTKTPWHIHELSTQWIQPLELRLNTKIKHLVQEKIAMRSGVTECLKENGGTADYLLYAAVKEAFLLNKSDLSIIEPLPLFNPNTLVSTVQNYFENQPTQWLLGVVENDRLIGVVQRSRLYAVLGTRYGVPLYSNRTISLIMDKNPLIVEDSTPIEVVSTLAMERPDAQLYEGIVVVNQQKPVGMVSVASMMKAIAERQIQIARGANPLTGLPGNIQIEREIKRRLDAKTAFGIIYADLNHFKHYNDLYGFEQGDIAIKMLAEILRQEALKLDEDTFVGHIGGDDFIIILGKEHVQDCCVEILDSFHQERQKLLGVVNLTVALAGLIIEEDSFTPITLAEKAAHVKREVKKRGGNAFLIK